MNNNHLKSATLACAFTVFGLTATSTSAQALTLTSKLLGDPRVNNPDNLIVDVTIKTGADAGAGYGENEALWIVDLNSPLHPNVKLDTFYFNLADSIKNLVTFSGFNPSNWTIGNGANANGSGGANFTFEADRTPPGGDVTNTVNLLFKMTSSGGALTLADFLGAPSSSGAGGVLVGQLGAHLQSLTPVDGQSNSGFAVGNYTPIPTPALLPGLVAMGVGMLRKQKKEKGLKMKAEV